MGSKERTGQACDKAEKRERSVTWAREAQDREHWRSIGEVYAQKLELSSAAT